MSNPVPPEVAWPALAAFALAESALPIPCGILQFPSLAG
jgi:hypothetical protein